MTARQALHCNTRYDHADTRDNTCDNHPDTRYDHDPEPKWIGNIEHYEKDRQLAIFVWPLLQNSRMLHSKPVCKCIPLWFVIWAVPCFLAGCGFLLQNFQLRIGTYHYVHKMLQFDLVRTQTKNFANYTSYIPLTVGQTPQNVSFGSLDDPVTSALGGYKKVDISSLDMLAALFPFLFVMLAVAMDKPFVWARIMLCFFVLSTGKGLFAWITVVPDSNGWQACQARLAPGSYPVDWYAKERSILEILLMDPRSRLCADMMWSGHTYFVTLFAFGLHECVRRGMRASSAKRRILVESLVAVAAVLQQTVEIYFVLKSRFHYTSDVVMAVFVTYLLYTNSVIAVLASWWNDPGNHRPGELSSQEEFGLQSKKFAFGQQRTWLQNGLQSEGSNSLGCCCFASSRQWIYKPEDIHNIVNDIEKATKGLHDDDPLKMDDGSKMLLLDAMGLLREHSICNEGCADDAVDEDEIDLSHESSCQLMPVD